MPQAKTLTQGELDQVLRYIATTHNPAAPASAENLDRPLIKVDDIAS